MNKKRKLKCAQALEKIRIGKEELESIKDEEDDARENIHENFQNTELYEDSEEWSDALEDAISSIEEGIETVKAKL